MTEAERLALHNTEMKLALAENISLPEARAKLAKLRIEARERALESRDRCGTTLGQCQSNYTAPKPYWWQKL